MKRESLRAIIVTTSCMSSDHGSITAGKLPQYFPPAFADHLVEIGNAVYPDTCSLQPPAKLTLNPESLPPAGDATALPESGTVQIGDGTDIQQGTETKPDPVQPEGEVDAGAAETKPVPDATETKPDPVQPETKQEDDEAKKSSSALPQGQALQQETAKKSGKRAVK